MDLSPKAGADKFQCPHCRVVSQQTWFDVRKSSQSANAILKQVFYDYRSQIRDYEQNAISAFIPRVEEANQHHMHEFVPGGFSVATCASCNGLTLWVDKQLVYPKEVPTAAVIDAVGKSREARGTAA